MINKLRLSTAGSVKGTIRRGKDMYRVIICDDDQFFAEKLSQSIQSASQQLDYKLKIHVYTDLDQIGKPILSSCDIAFLDIDFQGKNYNGLEIARKLRNIRRDAIIIFVTNYIEYAPEGYEVQAFRYALKSEVFEKLPRYLQEAFARLKWAHEKLKIQVNGEIIDIPIEDILYIEANLHTLVVNVQKDKIGKTIKQYVCYGSLSNMEKQLEQQGFLRTQKSFLVNMRHIQKYQCNEMLLKNGKALPVSTKNYSEQKKKYLQWKGWQ